MTGPRLAPSILSADFSKLGDQLALVEQGGADAVHIDVMDGRFVPNITVGLPVVKALRRRTDLPLDVHLMIVEPSRYIEKFVEAGADWVSIHYEAEPLLHRSLCRIRELGAKAGVVLNPASPVHLLENAIHEADFVLLMSVEPGFGGQRFIEPVLSKIEALRRMLRERDLERVIQVDGGITKDNCRRVVLAGADVLVAGAAVFAGKDPAEAVRELKKSMRSDQV